jgi:hypothetical protein
MESYLEKETFDIREKIHGQLLWWEEAAIVEQYHHRRQAEFGSRRTGRPTKKEGRIGWGIRDTARELKLTLGSVAESLQLARALRSDAALKSVRDKKSAIQLVRIAARLSQREK